MSKFNIGDRVISKGYPHLGEEVGIVAGIDIGADAGDGKYLVKFNSLDIYTGWGYGVFCYDSDIIVEPYEGYAEWVDEDDLVKVEDECEKGIKSEFNVGDKVVAKDYPSIVKEVGIIVGIDPREECFGKYLVKFDSLDGDNGWAYGVFINNSYYNIEPYEGRAIWLDDLEKVEEECEEEKCEEGEVYMNEFNIGDEVMAKDSTYFGEEVGVVVGIDTRENASKKYLVKFDSLEEYEGWAYGYRFFINNPDYIIEPYEGRAVWIDGLIKVKNESEEVCMNEFNIGDKVISNDDFYPGKDVGVIVGIDPEEETYGKYLVKFNSIRGLEYEHFSDNPNLIVEPYEGEAMWLDDLIKVEEECEEECEEDKHEEDIRVEFDKVREQKKEIIKGISEKILEMTLEIKELEAEIEKIKKEWHL